MKRVALALMFCLFLSIPASAQTPLEVVQQAKAALVTAGVALNGPCGAFAITRLAVWQMRGSGAGLLTKPTGNNCEGYAVDILMYPNGNIVDILADAGGANTPAWQPGTAVDPARYHAAIEPDFNPPPPPVPQPTPDYTAMIAHVHQEVEDLRAQLADVKKMLAFDASFLKDLSDKQHEFSDKLDGLKIITDQLVTRPVVASCSASVAGIPIRCRINNFGS